MNERSTISISSTMNYYMSKLCLISLRWSNENWRERWSSKLIHSKAKFVSDTTSAVLDRIPFLSVFNQGDQGKSWYIILKGSVQCVVYGKGVVGTFHEGDDFGKLSLVNNSPRFERKNSILFPICSSFLERRRSFSTKTTRISFAWTKTISIGFFATSRRTQSNSKNSAKMCWSWRKCRSMWKPPMDPIKSVTSTSNETIVRCPGRDVWTCLDTSWCREPRRRCSSISWKRIFVFITKKATPVWMTSFRLMLSSCRSIKSALDWFPSTNRSLNNGWEKRSISFFKRKSKWFDFSSNGTTPQPRPFSKIRRSPPFSRLVQRIGSDRIDSKALFSKGTSQSRSNRFENLSTIARRNQIDRSNDGQQHVSQSSDIGRLHARLFSRDQKELRRSRFPWKQRQSFEKSKMIRPSDEGILFRSRDDLSRRLAIL